MNKMTNINLRFIYVYINFKVIIKIQMHVPIQLPCYDLIKIANLNIIETFKIIKTINKK